MPSIEQRNRIKLISRRRRWIVGAVVLCLVFLYSILWFFLALKVEEKVAQQINHSEQRGVTVLCENMHKTGYPLRIGVACDTFNLRKPMKGFSFSSEKLTAGAPVYAPHSLDLTIQSPISLEVPGLVPLSAKWDSLALETDIGQRVPDSLKMIVENLNMGAKAEAGALIEPVEAKFLRFDADGINSTLNARLTFDALSLPFIVPKENTKLPQLDGDIALTLNDSAELFARDEQGSWVERLLGHSGSLKQAKISFETGGSLQITGPFSFDEDGYLTAKFDIAISEQAEMLHTARALFPSQNDNLQTIFFALNAMPKNGDGDPVLTLSVNKGEARLGFIKLGHVDPL